MSRNFNNNSAVSSKSVQKHCKVCQDAGKSVAEYSSHFTRETRDPTSKVTCPTLLALECRYCYKNGHTVKYCPLLKEKDKEQKRDAMALRRAESITKVETKVKTPKNQNVFDCFDSDSDEEEEVKPVVSSKKVTKVEIKEDFPELCAPVKRTQPILSNYAQALAAPISEPIIPRFVAEKEVTKAPWNTGLKASEIDWTAMEDSDSDYDDEEEIFVNKGNIKEDYDSDW